MKSYDQYCDYFENLCIQSVDIDHDPDNGKQAFFTIHLDELINGMRNKIEADGIFIVLTDYVWKPNSINGNYFKSGEAMFFVLGTSSPGDFEAHKALMTKCENVAVKFINRIHLDSIKDQGSSDSVWYGMQNELDFDNVMPLQSKTGVNHYGFQVVFRFGSVWNECVNIDDWADKDTPDSVNPNTPNA